MVVCLYDTSNSMLNTWHWSRSGHISLDDSTSNRLPYGYPRATGMCMGV